jgi:CRP-like cAMP-binding protein
MARSDPRKLKDDAQDAVTKGKWKRALEAYEQLAQVEDREGAWPQKAGEMNRKLGRGADAVLALGRAADLYSQQGFLLKAIACCKLILEIDPDHTATQGRLASLHAERGVGPASPQRPTMAPPLGGATSTRPGSSTSPPLIVPPRSASTTPIPVGGLRTPTLELDPDQLEEVARAAPPPPRPTTPLPLPPQVARARTLPPDATLDEVQLSDIVDGSRITQEIPEAYEIPLDDTELQIRASAPGNRRRSDSSAKIAAVLPRVPLFSALDETQLRSLIERVDLVQLDENERVFRQGDEGDGLYVIASGEVAVVRESAAGGDTELARLGEGAFFGEIALLTRQKRTATVLATRTTDLLRVSRDLLLSLIEEEPQVLKVVLRFLRDRLIDSLTATSPLFTPFSGAERRELARRFVFIEAVHGAILLTEGSAAPGLFVLLAGAGQVSIDGATICYLGSGDMFGAGALLGNGSAAASVTALSKCFLLELPRSHFNELIMTHPQVLEYLSSMAEERRALLGDAADDDGGSITIV